MGPDVHGRALTHASDRTPARVPSGRADHARRSLRGFLEPVLAAVVFALFARTFLFQAFEVPSPSMEKSVLTGDRILVNKFVYAPSATPRVALLPLRTLRRGDVVVFRYPLDPRRNFIKRVIGLPRETVAIADKRVTVDGRELIEPYAFHSDDHVWPNDPAISEDRRRRDQLPPTRVPDDGYFVLGDNRDDSGDSRSWGAVPAGHVLGRALLVYWSVPPPPSGGYRSPAFLDALRRTRWDRLFAVVR